MLSIKRCRDILNEAAPDGVTYTEREAEQLRGVLMLIARSELETLRNDEDDAEGDSLQPRLYKRAS